MNLYLICIHIAHSRFLLLSQYLEAMCLRSTLYTPNSGGAHIPYEMPSYACQYHRQPSARELSLPGRFVEMLS